MHTHFSYIATEMNRQIARQRPAVEHYFTAAPPLQRVGQPSDVKSGLVYLLSDGSSYVTGVNLPIDGGMTTGNALTK
jgi:NAD(P)-dependent dehydrogenase (short-subunit alcohol dehydrogenase family)